MADPIKKSDKLTKKANTDGVVVNICKPDWFETGQSYKITNAPPRTAFLNFASDDLNFMARVLYAEASGSEQLTDKAERANEKQAILNVKHFRLNRSGYPTRSKTTSFTQVCESPGQFQSVFEDTDKFSSSAIEKRKYESLAKKECSDLVEAIEAVRTFFQTGPNEDYLFDNFRGGKGAQGQKIGLSRFWLSSGGRRLYENEK